MQADCSVELGENDERLELPWGNPEDASHYYDLKRQPELLLNIKEAHHNSELGEFLSAINSHSSMLESVKCDTWVTDRIAPEEEVYGALWKYASYVDLIFSELRLRLSFDCHDNFAHRLIRLLHKVPEISAAVECIVRRCFYQREEFAERATTSSLWPETSLCASLRETGSEASPLSGFYFTFYLFGYGDDQDDARCRWSIALKLVENAILQLSALHRRGADQTAAISAVPERPR